MNLDRFLTVRKSSAVRDGIGLRYDPPRVCEWGPVWGILEVLAPRCVAAFPLAHNGRIWFAHDD
jgi:hypothetical protein